MSTRDHILVRCHSCQGVNRIPKTHMNQQPVCGKCKQSLKIPDHPLDIVSGQFHEGVLNHPGAVLVDLWSPGCVYCTRMMPLLERIAKRFQGDLLVVRVDVSKYPDIAGRFKIRGVPYLTLYNKGKQLASLPGALNERQLLNWLYQHLGW